MPKRRILVAEINPCIINLVTQTFPILERMTEIALDLEEDSNEDSEFLQLGKELDSLYEEIGSYLTEDISRPILAEMERRSRKGGQADGCPPREAQLALH